MMMARFGLLLALTSLTCACGGSDFGSGGGGTGGGAGSGGTPGTGGTTGTGSLAVVRASTTELSTEEVPTITFGAVPEAGHAVIVGITCISDYLADCVILDSGVTDDQGNTYTRVVQGEPLPSSSQAARGYLFIAENVAASGGSFTIRVDPEGSTINQSVVWGAIEVSGLATPPSLDAWGSSLSGSGTSTTAATDLPTTQANELAVAVFSMRSDDTNMLITPQDGWVTHHIHQNNASGPPGHAMISQLQTSAGVVSHTWTHDAPTRSAAAVIATFKGALPN